MKFYERRIESVKRKTSSLPVVLFTAVLLISAFFLNLEAAIFIVLVIAIAAVAERRASRRRNLSINRLLPYFLGITLGGLTIVQTLVLLFNWISNQALAPILFILAAPLLLLMLLFIAMSGFVLLFCLKVIMSNFSQGRFSELWLEFKHGNLAKKMLLLLILIALLAAVAAYIYWLGSGS